MSTKAEDVVCRACMRPAKTTAVPLTVAVAKLYGQLINSYVSLKDGLPQQVCSKCSKLMVKFANFREMCISSEQAFKYQCISKQVIGKKIQGLFNLKEELKVEVTHPITKVETEEEDEIMDTDGNDATEGEKLIDVIYEEKFIPYADCDDERFENYEALEIINDYDSADALDDVKEFGDIKQRLRRNPVKRDKHTNEKQNSFPCGLCINVYDNLESVWSHLDSHKYEKACGLCEETFFNWPQLVAHRANHFPGTKKKYHCYICTERFPSEPYLVFHLSTIHFDEKGALCKVCGKMYASALKLKKHLSMHNVPESKLSQCNVCSKKYKSKQALRSHMAVHSDDKNHVCDICGHSYKHVAGLKEHKMRKHASINSNLGCGICEENPPSNYELMAHLETHKNDRTCKICGMSFEDWPQLVTHRYEHVSHVDKYYDCHLCPKKFSATKRLEIHFHTVHSAGIRCEVCSKIFFNGRKLNKHMHHHTSTARFKCDLCDKSFRNRQYLKNHLGTHSMEKNYACEQCDFKCNFPGGLKQHTDRRHKLGTFGCSHCDKVCNNLLALQDHEKRHNLSAKIICPHCGKNFSKIGFARHLARHTNPRVYKCDLCPKQFMTKQNLIIHINKHNGIRPHKCEICSMRFYNQGVLIKHRRVHTGEKPYVCHICNRGFTGNHNLKVHMKVHGMMLVVKRNVDSV